MLLIAIETLAGWVRCGAPRPRRHSATSCDAVKDERRAAGVKVVTNAIAWRNFKGEFRRRCDGLRGSAGRKLCVVDGNGQKLFYTEVYRWFILREGLFDKRYVEKNVVFR